MTEKEQIEYIISKGYELKKNCIVYGYGYKILRHIKHLKRKKRLFTKKQTI